jgi:hypothetical protein
MSSSYCPPSSGVLLRQWLYSRGGSCPPSNYWRALNFVTSCEVESRCIVGQCAIFSCASVSETNQCTCKHCSRKLPLNESRHGLSAGLPGRKKVSVTGGAQAQQSSALLINALPLSTWMRLGSQCTCWGKRCIMATTSYPLSDWTTWIARH